MTFDKVVDQFDALSTRYTGGEYIDEEFWYRLLKPDDFELGQLYPLVLFLHGIDRRGTDNRAQLHYLPELMARPEYRERFPCFLLAPQCRPDRPWVETPRAADAQAPRQAPGPQMSVVIQIFDEVLRQYPIDPSRLYLTGLSMGGYAAWDLGTRLADRWAAVAPMCGAGDDAYAARLVDVPVWAWHGVEDETVPIRKSRRMIDAIRQAGGQPKFTELPGVGHDCWTPAYHDPNGVIPWMFEQRRGWARLDSTSD